MGEGSLLLKKSWHPGLLKNQKRVYEEEQRALEERKKAQDRIREIREERQKEELERAAGKTKVDRVEWMYQGQSSDQSRPTEELEAFLLGKRRIDSIILKDDQKKQLEKDSTTFTAPAVSTARDTASKLQADPLLAMKKAILNKLEDPLQRLQLTKNLSDGKPKSKSREERHHKRRHRHRHHSPDSSDERRHRRRSRSRSRSRSPRRHDDADRGGRYRRRAASTERDEYRHRRRSRSRSPRRSEDRRRYRDRDDQSPGHKHRVPDSASDDGGSSHRPRRADSRERRDRRDKDTRRNEPRDDGYSNRRERDFEDRNARTSRRDNYSKANHRADEEEERARKLAAMQEDATELDTARERRLAAIEERERASRAADDRARERAERIGGENQFIHGLHRKANEMGLGERIGRGKRGLRTDED